MRRCPRCAETVQSAAVLCRHCGHEFAAADDFGAIGDTVNGAVKWLSGMALVLIALWLITHFVIDYNRAQAQLNAAEIVAR